MGSKRTKKGRRFTMATIAYGSMGVRMGLYVPLRWYYQQDQKLFRKLYKEY